MTGSTRDQVAVEGGSYGGQLTNWLITQTTRFKAAIPSASISNLISLSYTIWAADYPRVEFKGYPWENGNAAKMWERLRARAHREGQDADDADPRRARSGCGRDRSRADVQRAEAGRRRSRVPPLSAGGAQPARAASTWSTRWSAVSPGTSGTCPSAAARRSSDGRIRPINITGSVVDTEGEPMGNSLQPQSGAVRHGMLVVAAGGSDSPRAQGGTGHIDGTVRDAQGGALPGVLLTLRNQDTGFTRTVTTEADGRYVFEALQPGRYMVKAELSGFATQEVPDTRHHHRARAAARLRHAAADAGGDGHRQGRRAGRGHHAGGSRRRRHAAADRDAAAQLAQLSVAGAAGARARPSTPRGRSSPP